jgi:hypothetical protein
VGREEASAPLESAGIRIVAGEAGPCFAQPCAAHEPGRCKVYAHRPAQCRKFRCKLLDDFESGRIGGEQAREKIGQFVALRASLMKGLDQSGPGPAGTALTAMAALRGAARETFMGTARDAGAAQVALQLNEPSSMTRTGNSAAAGGPIPLHARVRVPDSVLMRSMGDEMVMLDLEKENYFGLNEVGARVMQIAAPGATLEAIVDQLLEEFEVRREQAEQDVRQIAAELIGAGLLEREPA